MLYSHILAVIILMNILLSLFLSLKSMCGINTYRKIVFFLEAGRAFHYLPLYKYIFIPSMLFNVLLHCLRAYVINFSHISCIFNKRFESQPSSELNLFGSNKPFCVFKPSKQYSPVLVFGLIITAQEQ